MADLNRLLFDVDAACPVCSHKFKAQRVRKSALVPDGRDTDFYVRYRDFDPTDYSVWQCPNCGYANADATFGEMNPAERHVLTEALQDVQPLTVPRERDVATVMALFERAIFSARARKSRSREAALHLRMAWVHRRLGNKEQEQASLRQAYDSYLDAYQSEPLPFGKMSELAVQYLLGELSRRLGNFHEAVRYFAGVTQARGHSEPQIANMAKEQWEVAREEAARADAAGEAAASAGEAAAAAPAATAAARGGTVQPKAPAAAVPATEPDAAPAPAGPAPDVEKPVLAGFSIRPSQLDWLRQVAGQAGLDRSVVLQAVLAVAQALPPKDVARPDAAALEQAVRQGLAGGR